jgi:hypothetical protein
MQMTRAFSFVLLAAFAGACSSSSSSDAPVIDSLSVPTTASVSTVTTSSGAEQVYVIAGAMNFHDSSENVASFTAHVTTPANEVVDSTVSLPSPTESGPVQIQLGFPQGGPFVSGATIDYQVSLTSVSGKVSAPVSETVTLQ